MDDKPVGGDGRMTAGVDAVRSRALDFLAEEGPLTTAELTGRLQRDGLDVDSGRVHALLTAEALGGLVEASTHDVAGLVKVPLWSIAQRGVLWWEKPPKAEPYEEWAKYQADSAPPGTYVPNMDDLWKARWKARLLGVRSGPLRVEVRKSVGIERSGSVQVKLIVAEDGSVTMSMNGTAGFSGQEWGELAVAVSEARAAIEEHKERERA